MRGRIACSAERLSLLDPLMIQGVVPPTAFQIGHQYSSERRVRIDASTESQITSAVEGNSGRYEQTIRLQGGYLEARCSCTLTEEPLCRHCVAALLEYHRWAQPGRSQQQASGAGPVTRSNKGAKPEAAYTGTSTDVKLSDVLVFTEWMQTVVEAFEQSQALPQAPNLQSGPVAAWIQAITNLDEKRRQGEEAQLNLQTDMQNREAYVARLTEQLGRSLEEAKVAQAASKDLQRELTSYRSMGTTITDVAQQIEQFDGELRSVAVALKELAQKGSKLEALAEGFQEVATGLTALAKRDAAQAPQ